MVYIYIYLYMLHMIDFCMVNVSKVITIHGSFDGLVFDTSMTNTHTFKSGQEVA